MPATLRTIDMRPVYDGGLEQIMKVRIVCNAIFLSALGLGIVAAQAQNQPPALPTGQPSTPMGGMSEMHKPAPPAGPLEIKFGDKSATWTPATLATLPHVTVSVHNEHTKAEETYSGVPLIALLTPLGVTDKPHGKDLRLYLVAAGSDGYEAVYSIGEVTPDVHDATVIVADTENGKPLTGDGPLKLISTGEKRPARWVRNLVAIKVMAAE
jgi:hypothetical protein